MYNLTRLKILKFSILFSFLVQVSLAEVIKVEIDSRETILDGKNFGQYGQYELLRGRIFFSFDPVNYANSRITDIYLAPRNDKGMIEAWSDLVVLKPVDQAKSRKVALVEVSNWGGKFSPRYFNMASSANLDPNQQDDFGDGLLMELGLTVIWIGWQFDVPEGKGLKLRVPVAKNHDGSEIYGLVRSDWVVDEKTTTLKLGHVTLEGYKVALKDDQRNVLTVRDNRDAKRIVVDRNKWKFAREIDGKIVDSEDYVYSMEEFETGKIYELVYVAKDPPVVGLGMAAIRNVIAFAKYDATCQFKVDFGVAAGVSQTGRFLRHYLYQNFNSDEEGRKAYDGLMIITAGAGRGSFNHRFAQPSRDAHRYRALVYPTDIFPFTSQSQFDLQQFKSDGLFASANTNHLPKIFYINTGYEYWGRAASLIHSSLNLQSDISPLTNERIYHIASGQHFVERWPSLDQAKNAEYNMYRGDPLDFFPNYRALLTHLVNWSEDSGGPPDSQYPTISNSTLVDFESIRMPEIPGMIAPEVIHTAYRVDYGPRWNQGIVDFQPPITGKQFVPKVSQVDEHGNELGGIRNTELRVPIATYTPWNLRIGMAGNNGELTNFRGTYLPFPKR